MLRFSYRRADQVTFRPNPPNRNPFRLLLLEAMAIELFNAGVATGVAYVLSQDWLRIFAALQIGLFVTAYRLIAVYRIEPHELAKDDCPEPHKLELKAKQPESTQQGGQPGRR